MAKKKKKLSTEEVTNKCVNTEKTTELPINQAGDQKPGEGHVR